jgi:nucleoside-diphosphate-sugar epimerase
LLSGSASIQPLMRVLVTGGAGFIGSHLAVELAQTGADVRILDNFATGRRSNLRVLGEDVEVVEGDIQSYERVTRAIKGCDYVMHQAALPSVPRSVQDPLTSNATNVVGTLNVLLAARDHDIRRVVLASSSSVYGANPKLPKQEDDPTLPISPYATAKLAGEGYGRAFHEVYGLETVMLRYFNVFGPRQDPTSQYSAVIPRFITAILQGERPIIFGDGEQSRDFTPVANIVRANILAMEAEGCVGRAYNIACGSQVTLNELVRDIGDLIGRPTKPVYAAPRVGDVKFSHADITRARTELGYEPLVDVRTGLEATLEHIREHELTMPEHTAMRSAAG